MDVNDAYVDVIYDILFCFIYNCSLRGSQLFKYSVWYVCSLLQLLNVFYLCTVLLDSIYLWRDYIWFIKNDSFKINKLKIALCKVIIKYLFSSILRANSMSLFFSWLNRALFREVRWLALGSLTDNDSWLLGSFIVLALIFLLSMFFNVIPVFLWFIETEEYLIWFWEYVVERFKNFHLPFQIFFQNMKP